VRQQRVVPPGADQLGDQRLPHVVPPPCHVAARVLTWHPAHGREAEEAGEAARGAGPATAAVVTVAVTVAGGTGVRGEHGLWRVRYTMGGARDDE
jgi:hypothetical protein